MTSKYLRELAMRAFNDFWCGRVPDLAPTAGYPGDARRFHAPPCAKRSLTLGIDDAVHVARLASLSFCCDLNLELTPCCCIIVRHAYAGQHGDPRYPDDDLRPLTTKGRKQFRQPGQEAGPPRLCPGRRRHQPAGALPANGRRDRRAARIGRTTSSSSRRCGPAAIWSTLVEWTNAASASTVAWVGHSPDVEQLAAALIGAATGPSLCQRRGRGNRFRRRADTGPRRARMVCHTQVVRLLTTRGCAIGCAARSLSSAPGCAGVCVRGWPNAVAIPRWPAGP